MQAVDPAVRQAQRYAPGTSLALLMALIAAAVVIWGLLAGAAGVGLGTPAPPFFVSWDPALGTGAVPWLLLLVAATVLAVAVARASTGPAAFVIAATLLALVARLALAAGRDGTAAWYSVFGTDPEAANEYLPALPALDLGLGAFLDRFAEIAPSLPIHPSAHPPGLLLLLEGLGIGGPRAMASLVVIVGIAAVPLTYVLARRLGLEDRRARIAAMLTAFSPAAMLYGVSSADALFATLGVLVVLLLVGGAASRLAGALALALASFFSWALLASGAFAAVVVALREGPRSAAGMTAVCAGALLAFYGLLHAVTGYDPLGALAAANEAYELGISSARPWAFWVLGSPVAFLVALGLPISWYAARALGIGVDVAVGLAVIIGVAAILGFSKAETERIWLFMVPFAAVAATWVLPWRHLPLAIGLLVAQAVAAELALETIW